MVQSPWHEGFPDRQEADRKGFQTSCPQNESGLHPARPQFPRHCQCIPQRPCLPGIFTPALVPDRRRNPFGPIQHNNNVKEPGAILTPISSCGHDPAHLLYDLATGCVLVCLGGYPEAVLDTMIYPTDSTCGPVSPKIAIVLLESRNLLLRPAGAQEAFAVWLIPARANR